MKKNRLEANNLNTFESMLASLKFMKVDMMFLLQAGRKSLSATGTAASLLKVKIALPVRKTNRKWENVANYSLKNIRFSSILLHA
ncbi:hypothetical protein [Paenibacillus sp. 2KB_22]|uniref:hypothetical protein n=1 Tax=Paenibacillus sp. 2KB_22 TaxID=3232978 RepID=UPI003F95C164